MRKLCTESQSGYYKDRQCCHERGNHSRWKRQPDYPRDSKLWGESKWWKEAGREWRKERKERKEKSQTCRTGHQFRRFIKLEKDKLLNLTLALDHYKYGLEISNGNIRKSWNIYNTGNKKIINDRIYQMKGIIMVLEQEVKNNKLLDYKVALNDKK